MLGLIGYEERGNPGAVVTPGAQDTAANPEVTMASISVCYQWGKNQALTVEIYAEDSFPDAVDEAASQAVRAMKGALADIVSTEGKAGE